MLAGRWQADRHDGQERIVLESALFEEGAVVNKATGWFLSIIAILCVASVAVSAVLLGRMVSMSKQLGALATAVTVVQQGESTILSRTARHSGNSAAANNGTGAGTGNLAANSANSANSFNSTNSVNSAAGGGNSTQPQAQMTAAQAEAVAAHIPAIKIGMQTDPNFTAIPQGTSTTSNGYIYMTIEYADKMQNHVSALFWVDVRADGLVRNHMSQGPWVQPSKLTLGY